jgi:hypothetical protein
MSTDIVPRWIHGLLELERGALLLQQHEDEGPGERPTVQNSRGDSWVEVRRAGE